MVGLTVGLVDGRTLGSLLCRLDGLILGLLDGSVVGLSVSDGRSVKVVVGTRLGSKI